MSESTTCPVCKRVSYHPEDIRHRYCGACHVSWPPEMGRELKASELEPRTIVILTKETRPGIAISAWVKDVGQAGVTFYAGELRMLLIVGRIGDDLTDEEARLHVYQYIEDGAPTSGKADNGSAAI